MFDFVLLAFVVKQEQTPTVKQEAEVNEEKTNHKPPVFDNRVSTITTVIKSESRDTDALKNAVSVVMAPGTAVPKQEVNKEEEAERAVVRSNQQAKIPLKKRELKLTESFHSNHLNNNSSSIIVCNPSVIQTKDGREAALPHSSTPPGGLAASQQQLQEAGSALRQELTNGRSSLLLPHKEGQNGVIGVIGQVGVIGHVGVIRSPSERHRTHGAEQQEENGPTSDHSGSRAVEEEREVSRQSVLIRTGPVEGEVTAASVTVCSLSQPTEETKTQTAEVQEEKTTEEQSDMEKGTKTVKRQEEDLETRFEGSRGASVSPVAEEGSNHEKNKSNLEKVESEPASAVPRLQESLQEVINGETVAQLRVKDTGLGSQEGQGPLEEASSELQKEGIRLKIKIPPHRRNKLRGKEEEKEREQVQEEGRSLRRSARICRYVSERIHETVSGWCERTDNKFNTNFFLKIVCFAKLQAELEGG